MAKIDTWEGFSLDKESQFILMKAKFTVNMLVFAMQPAMHNLVA